MSVDYKVRQIYNVVIKEVRWYNKVVTPTLE